MVCPFLVLKQHDCGFVGLPCPRGQAARSNAAPKGHREAARSCTSPRSVRAQASGVERGARAGKSPDENEAAVLSG